MSKRFTDTKKWRNEWFRNLSAEAKLTWIYLCDECESHGVLKIDYGLASFQLGFKLEKSHLEKWFFDKIHFISNEKILIIPFFEFQYGESKDSWSAKIQAKKKLENLGFVIENNSLIIPNQPNQTTVGTLSKDSDNTVLIRVIGNINNNKEEFDFLKLYELYPKKEGKTKGLKTCKVQIKTENEYNQLKTAIVKYRQLCEANRVDLKYIKQFSSFMHCWRDYLDNEVGKKAQKINLQHEQFKQDQQMAKILSTEKGLENAISDTNLKATFDKLMKTARKFKQTSEMDLDEQGDKNEQK